MEEKYRQEFRNIQMEKQEATITQNFPDKTVENCSELDHNTKMSGMALLEREEGEVPSFTFLTFVKL